MVDISRKTLIDWRNDHGGNHSIKDLFLLNTSIIGFVGLVSLFTDLDINEKCYCQMRRSQGIVIYLWFAIRFNDLKEYRIPISDLHTIDFGYCNYVVFPFLLEKNRKKYYILLMKRFRTNMRRYN